MAKIDGAVGAAIGRYGFTPAVLVLRGGSGLSAGVMGALLSEAPEALREGAGRARAVRSVKLSAGEGEADVPPTHAPRVYPRLGLAFGYIDAAGAERLAGSEEVDEVVCPEAMTPIRPVESREAGPRALARLSSAEASVAWGVAKIGAHRLWSKGLTGRGVRVAHLDTGIDADHPMLADRLHAYAATDLDGNLIPDATPADPDGHGTHTAGTIAGVSRGRIIGVAPGASLCSAAVIDGGRVLLRVLAGLEWALGQGCRVLSMSLGFRGYSPFFEAVMRSLRAGGMLPVVAIGNEGAGSSRSPGNYPTALSVGATDRGDAVARFSGSVRFAREEDPDKPDVVAPGVLVQSARPGGGLRLMSGTSMAAPHVAGLAALLFEAFPDASVEQVERAIAGGCVRLTHEPPVRQGAGRVDARLAHERLRSLVAG